MNKYYFNKLYGAIYDQSELQQLMLWLTDNPNLDVNDYISDNQDNGILIPMQPGCYVFMSDYPARNSFMVYHPELAENQVIKKYLPFYPHKTKITIYDYQKNKTEIVV